MFAEKLQERKKQLEECVNQLRLLTTQIAELQQYANAKLNEAAELRGAIRQLEELTEIKEPNPDDPKPELV
jgi:hypothetical protein